MSVSRRLGTSIDLHGREVHLERHEQYFKGYSTGAILVPDSPIARLPDCQTARLPDWRSSQIGMGLKGLALARLGSLSDCPQIDRFARLPDWDRRQTE